MLYYNKVGGVFMRSLQEYIEELIYDRKNNDFSLKRLKIYGKILLSIILILLALYGFFSEIGA